MSRWPSACVPAVRGFVHRRLVALALLVIGIAGLVLNEVLLWVFVDLFQLILVMAKVITAGLIFLWNFALRKAILFRQS